MRAAELYDRGRPVFSFEFFPPKSDEAAGKPLLAGNRVESELEFEGLARNLDPKRCGHFGRGFRWQFRLPTGERDHGQQQIIRRAELGQSAPLV